MEFLAAGEGNSLGSVPSGRAFFEWVYKRLPSLFADKTTLYRIPEDLYVSILDVGHAGIVNSKFLYQTEQSLLQIESLIRLNDSVGIFDKQTDQLLCWAISMDLTLS